MAWALLSAVRIKVAAAASEAWTGELQGEHADCVGHLPECLSVLVAQGQQEEVAAYGILQAWLVSLYLDNPYGGSLADNSQLRASSLAHLLHLGEVAKSSRPGMALAVGQMLISFFWWGGANSLGTVALQGPCRETAAVALDLLEVATRYAGCQDLSTPISWFLARSCPWRFRFVIMVGTELARKLLRLHDIREAALILNRTRDHWERVQQLSFFRETRSEVDVPGTPLASRSAGFLSWNQNQDFLPTSAHWPIWPREAWPSFAHFLEANYETFRQSLEDLLELDPNGEIFEALASQQQSEMAPRRNAWVRLDLVHGGGFAELCALPALQPSCDILAQRPEIDGNCSTYLAGAALARLLPGDEIKPHFDSHCRLSAHLGLRAVEGASMMVGGKISSWQEGRTLVFDDTYVHSVRHHGVAPRYLLDLELESPEGTKIAGFLVLDGHSGSLCCDHLMERLPGNLQKCLSTKPGLSEETLSQVYALDGLTEDGRLPNLPNTVARVKKSLRKSHELACAG
ncbi:unnamed protein product [Durusdinium trenchii]|uniref:Aspartyl/asparaginy/proline hydroxylase domain-containing protein n=1 Tax=Durusdinium trenchii TaxID=1381693 RepID=A0ABP0PUU3_9DINO